MVSDNSDLESNNNATRLYHSMMNKSLTRSRRTRNTIALIVAVMVCIFLVFSHATSKAPSRVQRLHRSLLSMLERYTVIRDLNAGASAVVVMAKDKQSNQDVAIKRIHKSDKMIWNFEREVAVAEKANELDPEHTMAILNYWEDESDSYIVQEMGPPDLVEALMRKVQRKEFLQLFDGDYNKILCTYLFDVSSVSKKLNDIGIINGDMKLENTLFAAETKRFFVIDFGGAFDTSDTDTALKQSYGGTTSTITALQRWIIKLNGQIELASRTKAKNNSALLVELGALKRDLVIWIQQNPGNIDIPQIIKTAIGILLINDKVNDSLWDVDTSDINEHRDEILRRLENMNLKGELYDLLKYYFPPWKSMPNIRGVESFDEVYAAKDDLFNKYERFQWIDFKQVLDAACQTVM